MKEITVAGMSAKPMETTKEVKIPPADADLCLNFSVMGKGVVVTLNLKFGRPSALFRIAS
jgi:hypothetical protein